MLTDKDTVLTDKDIGQRIKLTDRIKNVVYANRDSGYCVVNLEHTKCHGLTGLSSCRATGTFKEIVLDESERLKLDKLVYEFDGYVVKNKHGIQIEFKSAELVSSRGYFILTRYVKNVGDSVATKILDKFPDLVSMLEADNLAPLMSIRGVSKKIIENIRKGYAENSVAIQFEILLRDKFKLKNTDRDLTTYQVQKIVDYFKTPLRCSIELEKDPYSLLEIKGFGFKTVDEMLVNSELVGDKTSEKRLSFGVKYWLENQATSFGDTLIVKEQAVDSLIEFLDVDESYILETIDKLQSTREVYATTITNDGDSATLIGLKKYYDTERNIYKNLFSESTYYNADFKISEREVNRFVEQFEKERNIVLNAQQREFLKLATSGQTRIALVGYAGTGKTTVCSAVVELLKKMLALDYGEDDTRIVSCAFTGVASERIGSVAQCDTKTIHRLLGFGKPKEDEPGMFTYNDKNKLPHRVILLDESSMIDVDLFHCLIRAVPTSTLFVMIGDPAQLPPIGAGNVFSDVVKQSVVPYVELKEIYRQSKDSVLTQFAEKIRNGDSDFSTPESSSFSALTSPNYKDFEFSSYAPLGKNYVVEHGLDEEEEKIKYKLQVQDAVSSKVQELLDSGVSKDDIQILSPLRGVLTSVDNSTKLDQLNLLGCAQFNRNLQKLFVDTSQRSLHFERRLGIDHQTKQPILLHQNLYIGDRMIHLRNLDKNVEDYALDGTHLESGLSRIFNGYIGKIVDIGENDFKVDYLIRGEGEHIYRRVHYDAKDFLYENIIDYAYAMTIHKSQGSQYSHVILPICPSHSYYLNNQLLYTAITRAKDKVHLIGSVGTFNAGVKKVSSAQRLTNLSLGQETIQRVLANIASKNQPDVVKEVSQIVQEQPKPRRFLVRSHRPQEDSSSFSDPSTQESTQKSRRFLLRRH